MAYIGARLKELRQARDLTQDQLAAKTGITRTDLSGIENDRISVGDERLSRIAAGLGISVLELAPAEEQPERVLLVADRLEALERRLEVGLERAGTILRGQKAALTTQDTMLDRLQGIEDELRVLRTALEPVGQVDRTRKRSSRNPQ